MKMLYLLLLSVGFIACSSPGTDALEENTQSDTTTLTERPSPVGIVDEVVYGPEGANATGKQITYYAELLLDSKIVKSSDDLDMNNGVMWYYETLDVSGGYAKVTGAVEGWYEFALWRMADGSDLVGMTSAGCGPVCDYDYDFYKFVSADAEKEKVTGDITDWPALESFKDEMWTKINEKYPDMEYPDDCQYWFNLPQKGTSMIVDISVGANEYEEPLVKLSWDKEQFTISEYYKEVK